jgi:hypothetical protein
MRRDHAAAGSAADTEGASVNRFTDTQGTSFNIEVLLLIGGWEAMMTMTSAAGVAAVLAAQPWEEA